MTAKDKKIIEDSEREGIPIFVLTAKDVNSVASLQAYFGRCMDKCTKEHLLGILARMRDFLDWQEKNPSRVKLPD